MSRPRSKVMSLRMACARVVIAQPGVRTDVLQDRVMLLRPGARRKSIETVLACMRNDMEVASNRVGNWSYWLPLPACEAVATGRRQRTTQEERDEREKKGDRQRCVHVPAGCWSVPDSEVLLRARSVFDWARP